MSRVTEKDRVRLQHMLDASQKILEFTRGSSLTSFRGDEKLQLAVIRLLEIAGEAANGVSDRLREEHGEIP
jgi:uncharacterized protein with HEPN domain